MKYNKLPIKMLIPTCTIFTELFCSRDIKIEGKINNSTDKIDRSKSCFIMSKSKFRVFSFLINGLSDKNEVILNEAISTPDIKIRTF